MRFLLKRTAWPATVLAMIVAGDLTRVLAAPTGQSSVSYPQLAACIEQCTQQWQVTAAERRFDEIGWAKDIRDAEQLARRAQRPIFLFTYDGRIALGRC